MSQQSAHDSSHHSAGASHGSMKSYTSGFILSVILTIIPFTLVMMPSLVSTTTAILIMVFMGLAQILVQLVFFLHMDTSSEQSWNVTALVFTALIVAILIGGTVWIMYHLKMNMMM